MKRTMIEMELIKKGLKTKGTKQLNIILEQIGISYIDVIGTFKDGSTKQYAKAPLYLLPTIEDSNIDRKTRLICLYVLGVSKLILTLPKINELCGTKYTSLAEAKSKLLGDFESLGFNFEPKKQGRLVCGYLVSPNYDKMREIERQFEIDNDCYDTESWEKYEANVNNMKSRTKNSQQNTTTEDEAMELTNMAIDKDFDIESVEAKDVEGEIPNPHDIKSDCEVVKVKSKSSLNIDEFKDCF